MNCVFLKTVFNVVFFYENLCKVLYSMSKSFVHSDVCIRWKLDKTCWAFSKWPSVQCLLRSEIAQFRDFLRNQFFFLFFCGFPKLVCYLWMRIDGMSYLFFFDAQYTLTLFKAFDYILMITVFAINNEHVLSVRTPRWKTIL